MCQPKEEGGLGVRGVKLVNLSLLTKWGWRLIQDDQMLWKRVIVEKYGVRALRVVNVDRDRWPSVASTWWNDLMSLEGTVGSNWFNS